MDAFLKSLLADQVHFVFVCWKEDSAGVIVGKRYFDLAETFCRARETATTWQELLAMLDPGAVEFIRGYMHTDAYTPEPEDEIDAIREQVWILHSDEFPFLQCAAESFALYGRMLPPVEGAVEAVTEDEEPLRYYPKDRYFVLKNMLEQAGHAVEFRVLPGKRKLYAY